MSTITSNLESREFFAHFLANTPGIFEPPRRDEGFQEQLQDLIDQSFPGAVGLKINTLSLEECDATFAFRRETAGVHGLMHGGAIFSAGSTLAGVMTMLHGDHSSRNVLTTDSSIRYLRPVADGKVRAVCKVKSREGGKILLQCDFFNEQKKRVARSLYTYILLSE